MLLAGDEFRRTQAGNNNAYCQDNETSWIDWSLAERHRELVEFTREVLALRRAHPVLRQDVFYWERDVDWFDPAGRRPDWHDPDQKALACLVRGTTGPDLYLMFNAGTTPVAFVVPDARPTGAWRVAIDTARPSASGAGEPGDAGNVLLV